jgi:methionine synthase II (cobalamin-independent)
MPLLGMKLGDRSHVCRIYNSSDTGVAAQVVDVVVVRLRGTHVSSLQILAALHYNNFGTHVGVRAVDNHEGTRGRYIERVDSIEPGR